jgi:hypothetical protein
MEIETSVSEGERKREREREIDRIKEILKRNETQLLPIICVSVASVGNFCTPGYPFSPLSFYWSLHLSLSLSHSVVFLFLGL